MNLYKTESTEMVIESYYNNDQKYNGTFSFNNSFK